MDELLHAIADYWGGKECPRNLNANGRFRFIGDEGTSLYEVTLPGKYANLAEIDGRPFSHRVPVGKVLVRCLTDAPDCWWYVHLNGEHRHLDGKQVNIFKATGREEVR